jgi:hypothetical protein
LQLKIRLNLSFIELKSINFILYKYFVPGELTAFNKAVKFSIFILQKIASKDTNKENSYVNVERGEKDAENNY